MVVYKPRSQIASDRCLYSRCSESTLDLSSCELDDIQLVMVLTELELLRVRPRSDLSKKLGGCTFETPGEVAKLKLQLLGMS